MFHSCLGLTNCIVVLFYWFYACGWSCTFTWFLKTIGQKMLTPSRKNWIQVFPFHRKIRWKCRLKFQGISLYKFRGISHNPIQEISSNQFQGISCYQLWRIGDQFRRISQEFPGNQSQKPVIEKFPGNSSKQVTKTGELL